MAFTRKNPNGTYRIPIEQAGVFRIEAGKLNSAYFGDFINELGAYEDSGLTAEQAKKLGALPKERLQDALYRAGLGITL